MAQVLIRQLSEETVQRLKDRARLNGHSLEAELRQILDAAVRDPMEELHAIRAALSGKRFSDSSDLIRFQ